MASEFEFEGLNALGSMFKDMGNNVEKADKQALKAGGEIIAERQKANVNRTKNTEYPHIQDNITVSNVQENDDGKFVSVGPNKKVQWKAKWLEYGTVKMPAYPFIEKGADEGANEATEVMTNIYLGAMGK